MEHNPTMEMPQGGEPMSTGQEAAPMLSQKKRRKSFRKKQKPKTKNVLTSPVNITIPGVTREIEASVMMLMRCELSTYDLRPSGEAINSKKTAPGETDFRKLVKEDRQKAIEEFEKQRPWEELNLRSQMVFGANQVMRDIQAGNLELVLASRQGDAVISHIAQMAAIHGCPSLAVNTLKEIGKLTGQSQLYVMGFKKLKEGDAKHFLAMVTFIKGKCSPIIMPGFTPGESLHAAPTQQVAAQAAPQPQLQGQQPTAQPAVTQPSPAAAAAPSAGKGKQNQHRMVLRQVTKDYSHLYVYKTPKANASTDVTEGNAAPSAPVDSSAAFLLNAQQVGLQMPEQDFISFTADRETNMETDDFATPEGNIAQMDVDPGHGQDESQTKGRHYQRNQKRKNKRKKHQDQDNPPLQGALGYGNQMGATFPGALGESFVPAQRGPAQPKAMKMEQVNPSPNNGSTQDDAIQRKKNKMKEKWKRLKEKKRQQRQSQFQPPFVGQMVPNPNGQGGNYSGQEHQTYM